MKEYRVYVFDYKKYLEDWYKHFENHVDGVLIEDFYYHEQAFGTLLPEAETFISLCEQDGKVYTLEAFSTELNNDNINTDNYLFYITNNY